MNICGLWIAKKRRDGKGSEAASRVGAGFGFIFRCKLLTSSNVPSYSAIIYQRTSLAKS